MPPQTKTRTSVGFKAGVKHYKLTYYTSEYQPQDTDILAAFRVTPQPGVPLDRYKGRCSHIGVVPREDNQYICYVAYRLDLFEEGSVTNMFTSIVGNVFRFKALRALRPPHSIQVERDKLNKYDRPLLGCTIKPKLGLSAKNYVYECLPSGLDFTKYDENMNSQPFMHWRDPQAETGEIKGYYLNATPVIDRQKNHGMHFRVLAKALRPSGGDHIHAGTLVGKLEGERDITLGFVDLLRDDYTEIDANRSIYFTQSWVSTPGVLPVASGGIHVWDMPDLTEIFGDDSVLQFGGGTLEHP
ncbi:LOW QUALITY PROTEIN: hypothetical protein Cgig2_028591 [Carnegiea gigantea]|uniref:Ribulose bisphosphate carboxylase large chain n=1 Tax=Carnegiea gigantea TaxID=171969 RepID=A0A9Q1QCY2_9CARY|nr:LOW QUALITY PROTEIN: hypothetical protein Cgig2_028591 [Carnegiea gigantea]